MPERARGGHVLLPLSSPPSRAALDTGARRVLLALVLATCGLGSLGRAAPPPPPHLGRVTNVTPPEGKGAVTVLVQVPSDRKVHPGQSAELVRGPQGTPIGYGVVKRVLKEIATVEVGTLIDPQVLPAEGDDVRFLDGFTSDARARTPSLPRGKVAGAHDRLVLLDFGRRAGLQPGHEVLLRDPQTRIEQGRLEVELIREVSGSGVLISGRAVPGAEAIVVGFVKLREEVDFVELNLLGVVAGQQDRRRGSIGVHVQRVLPGSPAQQGGVLRGDRILAIDGGVVKDIAQVRERVEARVADRVEVLLIRADRVFRYEVAFKPREPKDGGERGEEQPGSRDPGQSGERQPGEKKPGEQKPGEKKPGEKKPGEKKPGEK